VLSGFSISRMVPAHFMHIDFFAVFAPLGVIIFAFIGSAAIPEMNEIVGKDKKQLKNAIIIGTLVPIVLYLVFCLAVIGVVGLENFSMLSANEQIATIALSYYSLPVLGILANLLAISAMFTSFLTLGEALLEAYTYDYGLGKLVSFGLVMLVPLVAVLFDFTTFISALALSGAVAGGIDGILIVLAYWKAKKMGDRKPEFSLPLMRGVGYFIIGLFVFAIGNGLYGALV